MRYKFIKILFCKRDCGPIDSFIYINIDHVLSLTWSDEECNSVWCVKLVIEYVGQTEADIFWIRLRDFDKFIKTVKGE